MCLISKEGVGYDINFEKVRSLNRNSNMTPIVLFVYNRPWHVRQCLESFLRFESSGGSAFRVLRRAEAPGRQSDAYLKMHSGEEPGIG
jgi:hypothetical protein